MKKILAFILLSVVLAFGAGILLAYILTRVANSIS